jgi:hypothetical protein
MQGHGQPQGICLQLLEVFAQVGHELVKRGFLKWPKVYVDPSCGPELPLLQSMVLSMKGEMASSGGETRSAKVLKPGKLRVECAPDISDRHRSFLPPMIFFTFWL